MPNFSEALLARLTDPTRAAAIYGDLTELAQARGRLWFWFAYARTLFALTWRFMLALVAATVVAQICGNSFHLYLTHTSAAWRTTNGPFLLNSMGPLLAYITHPLWFVLPFAAVMYGTRDRFVQLTFAVTVGATVAFLFVPFASLACSIATLAIAVSALFSSTWRRPLTALLLTGAASFLAIAAVNAIGATLLSHHPDWRTSHFFTHYGAMMIFRSSLLLLAFACARVHSMLMERSPSGRTPARFGHLD